MDATEQLLKQKTILLVSKDRELSALRRKHERLASWLSLAQHLPELVGAGTELWETCRRFAESVVATLEIHAVLFLEQMGRGVLRRLGSDDPAAAQIELTPGDADVLAGASGGACNDADRDPLGSFAGTIGLHRFLWCRLELPGPRAILVVVGFDRERAQYLPPLEDADFLHFANAARQLELLLRNANLVEALAEEKRSLEELNEQLERRVAERTRELGDALRALQEADQRLRDDIEQARQFQEKMLTALPAVPDADFGAAYRPLERVGGDLFDVQALGSGRYRLFLADATGHGVQASMRTIVLKAEYERLSRCHDSPDTLLGELNERLVTLFPTGEMMCTACCLDVAVDPRGATARYSNAAHPPVLRFGAGAAEEIYRDSAFLGLERGTTWPEPLEFRLDAGDLLLAYSDGLSEQRDARGEGFDASLKRHRFRGGSAADAIAELMRDFEAFRGEVAVEDDVTVVALRLPRSSAGGASRS